jgi:hypothetical protein
LAAHHPRFTSADKDIKRRLPFLALQYTDGIRRSDVSPRIEHCFFRDDSLANIPSIHRRYGFAGGTMSRRDTFQQRVPFFSASRHTFDEANGNNQSNPML